MKEDYNYPEPIETVYEFVAPPAQKPERIDVFLARSVKNASRSKTRKAIDEGRVKVGGKIVKASYKVKPGDKIVCSILKPPPLKLIPENIPLDVLFEDEYLLTVNKPAGMVVHPGYGNRRGTLVNALLYHFGEREEIDAIVEEDEEESESYVFGSEKVRPGIVHRIDKDTSGLLVVAKDDFVLTELSKQFEKKTVERVYYALVWGSFKNDEGTIDVALARSPKNRKIFAATEKGGKRAITDYWVLERFGGAVSLLKIKLRTGRTHQIRAHFSYLKRPVIGDASYGGNVPRSVGDPNSLKIARKILSMTNRQLLHAKTLGFVHPVLKEKMRFDSELPKDFANVLNELRRFFY